MFICERCGSRYSAMHAAAMENCPRCMIREHTVAPLVFKAFRLPPSVEAKPERRYSAPPRAGSPAM